MKVKSKALSPNELTELIEFFDKQSPNINLFQLKERSLSQDRGLGCEAMNKCSGQGKCNNGACIGENGYDYFDCSMRIQKCPNNCHYHGECVDGNCVCDPSWGGKDCGVKICDNNCSGHGVCEVR